MKQWIKQRLKESLEEVSITPKPIFGSGVQHTVLKSHKHPDRLYKIGRKNDVEFWSKIFQENPKIFPKVYRIFPSKKNPYYYIAEIEKLDTVNAEADFDMVNQVIKNFPKGAYSLPHIHKIDNYYPNGHMGFLRDFKVYLNEIRPSDADMKKILKWTKTIYTMYKYLENKYDYFDRDLHSQNVAYDMNKNIKIIDI